MGLLAQQQQQLQQQHMEQQAQLQQQQMEQTQALQLQLQQLQQQQLLDVNLTLTPQQAAKLAKQQAAPPEPLTQAKIEAITHELTAAGGRLPLGKLCSKFEGLKRAQLDGVFELAQIGANGQVEVRLPGMEPVGVMMYGGEVVSQEMPLPPLVPEQIAEITAMIEAAGGIAPLSRITQQVKGVKKQQLEGHFEISSHRIGDKRRQYVRFLGTPLAKGKGRGKGSKDRIDAATSAALAADAAAQASATAQIQMAQAQHMMMLGLQPFPLGTIGQNLASSSVGSLQPTAAQSSIMDASVGTKRKFSEAYDVSNVK